MTPIQMSAQFAAYVWFNNQPENRGATTEQAHQFARQNWERFLPNAHEGFGRLLVRLAKGRMARKTRATNAVVAFA